MALSPDRKLVHVAWKESSLWVLTRPMRDEERPEVYEFRQYRSWSSMSGVVIIKERKRGTDVDR